MRNDRNFTAVYVFQEFPKWVTLKDGSQVLAENADEENILVGSLEERGVLLQKARDMGLNPHHKTGVEKLKQMIEGA